MFKANPVQLVRVLLALHEPAAEGADQTLNIFKRGAQQFTLGSELVAPDVFLIVSVISLASCVTAWN